jgi:hypothetical protein
VGRLLLLRPTPDYSGNRWDGFKILTRTSDAGAWSASRFRESEAFRKSFVRTVRTPTQLQAVDQNYHWRSPITSYERMGQGLGHS